MYVCIQLCWLPVVSALLEISKLLNTGLDAESLAICVRLCESGVNPEALANVIRELRRETAALKVILLCQESLRYGSISAVNFSQNLVE